MQAYLDTIRAKTGKGPEEFGALAAAAGHTSYGAVMGWLKAEFGLGHGHCNLIAQLVTRKDAVMASQDDKLEGLFAGAKAVWREPFAALVAEVERFGPDVLVTANRTYVNLQRSRAKFGILQVASGVRLDVGVKLKGVEPSGIAEAAGSWNAMVTHRIKLEDTEAIPQEVVDWLRRAYESAG